MGFSRQEYWSRLPFPSPGDLLGSGIEPASPALAGRFFTTEPPGKPHARVYQQSNRIFFFSMSFLLQEVRTLDYNEHRLYCNLVKAILQATKVILCGVPSFILTRRMHVFKTVFNCIVCSVTQDSQNLPHLNSITGKILPNIPEYLLSESRRNINQCLSLFPW